MASDITINSFAVVAGLGQFALAAAWSSPPGMGCLPYMQAGNVEFYAAATNNRALATKVADGGPVGVAVYAMPTPGTLRYFWARAVDPAGNFGPFFPVSATNGRSATTLTAAPGPDSIGPDELQPNAVETQHILNAAITTAKIGAAQITDALIDSLSAGKITAGTITALIALVGPTITGGLIRTAATGARIEISSSNTIRVINQFGVAVVDIRPSTSLTTAAMSMLGTGRTLTVEGGGSSASGSDSTVAIVNARNGPALNIIAQNVLGAGGPHNHAIRAYNDNAGGGDTAIATSPAVGGYGVYVETGAIYSVGGYYPFTGAHDAFMPKGAECALGDIVCDVKVIARSGIDDTVTEVERSSAVAQRSVIGVLSNRLPFGPFMALAALGRFPIDSPIATKTRELLAERYDILGINSLGEGQINVCGRGGDLAVGDYICTSDMAGKGQRQNDDNGDADDLQRRCTVARVREPVEFAHADEVKRVACIYLCG